MMKKPKTPANLGCGTENILLNGWTNEDDVLTADECAYHISYLLQVFSRVIAENQNITPKQASKQLIATAEREFDETYPHVLGNPNAKVKKIDLSLKGNLNHLKGGDAMLRRVPGHYGANQ